MISLKYLPLTAALALLTACGSQEDLPPDTDTTIAPKIANTDWPVIHQNNAATKDSISDGPTGASATDVDAWSGAANTVLLLLGETYLYQQPGQDSHIYAYDPNNVAAGPVHQADLGVNFPDMGGGIIDDQGKIWFNLKDRIVRLSEDLSTAVYSEHMGDTFPNIAAPGNNGMTMFSDGNILSTSTTKNAWLVSTQKNANDVFPVLAYYDFTEIQYMNEAILANETAFFPRPVVDENDEFIIMTENYMLKLKYDPTNQKIDTNALWAFKNPENTTTKRSSIGISHAVVMGDLACAGTGPLTNSVTMKVYCVDYSTGALRQTYEPFPNAPGASALHNLGGFRDTNTLVAIANDSDLNAGIALLDLNLNAPIGEPIFLNNISESFVLAGGNHQIYIVKRDTNSAPYQLLAIDAETRQQSVLYESPTTGNIRPGLGAVGKQGLYFPTLDALVHIRM